MYTPFPFRFFVETKTKKKNDKNMCLSPPFIQDILLPYENGRENKGAKVRIQPSNRKIII